MAKKKASNWAEEAMKEDIHKTRGGMDINEMANMAKHATRQMGGEWTDDEEDDRKTKQLLLEATQDMVEELRNSEGLKAEDQHLMLDQLKSYEEHLKRYVENKPKLPDPEPDDDLDLIDMDDELL